jgi:aminoglycoside phosphotransferase (APT) family kinase protein
LADWLGRHHGTRVRVTSLVAAAAGWSNETLVVEYETTDRVPSGPVRAPAGERRPGPGPTAGRRVVVRVAPAWPTFPHDDLAVQARVQAAVHAAGIPAPAPATVETDATWLGAPFLVMPFVDGHVPGEVPALDPWITGSPAWAQARLVSTLVAALVDIHRLDWEGAGLGDLVRGGADAGGQLDWWEDYVRWAGAPAPLAALTDGLAWCRDHCPERTHSASLLWGDARLGNLIVGEDRRLRAVLDWDMACIGPAEMDLAWFLVLQWSGEVLVGQRVPGFPRHDAVVADYERRLGRPVQDLSWYEVFALVRSLAVSNRQARVAQEAGVAYFTPPDERHPLVGLLERRIDAASR